MGSRSRGRGELTHTWVSLNRRRAQDAAGGQNLCNFAVVRIGRLVLALFVVLQIADGLMTFGAVRIFGTGAEANPILETWIQLAGPGVTLFAAKSIACGAAALLYVTDRQKTLVALTGVLLCCAIVPWLALLATLG